MKGMKEVAFVTFGADPEITADDGLAVPHLEARGIRVSALPWDLDPGPLGRFDAIVLRSCWNYHLETARFEAWLQAVEAAGVVVFNPLEVVRWNLRKTYLQDLAGRGATIPQTLWLEAGARADLAELLEAAGIDQAVVKPVVSLSAHNTWRISIGEAEAHQATFAAQLEAADLMVQAFVPGVLTGGELSFVFFDGRFSHAVRKVPKAGDFRVQSDHGGRRMAVDPPRGLLEQAEAIVRMVGAPLLYARVDGIDVDGRLTLMELEVTDPALYLREGPGAAQRFAEAVAASLERR